MPELPEVETVRTGLEEALAGRLIEKVEMRRMSLRFAMPEDFAEFLTGRRFGAFRRRGKYLIIETGARGHLLAHLGMSGRFTVIAGDKSHAPYGKHDHVIFHIEGGGRLIYTDPRRFGVLDLVRGDDWQKHRLLAKMGIEPLGNAMNGTFLLDRARGRRTALKSFLLDQRIIAGLGNIYVCEALYRAGISPERPALSLVDEVEASQLALAIQSVLREAIAAGGSTLRDYAQSNGELGYFQHSFAVYGRGGEDCPAKGCGATIVKITQAGRSSFYCPKCQG